MYFELEYYRDERVIRRMLEYCGVHPQQSRHFRFTPSFKVHDWRDTLAKRGELADICHAMCTEYLVGAGRHLQQVHAQEFMAVEPWRLGWLLDNSLDVFRSIWDRHNTLGIIDVEYYSSRQPWLAYIDQVQLYEKLESLHWALLQIFWSYDISPLVIATGQGYHYVFRVHNQSPVAERLTHLGVVLPSTREKYAKPRGLRNRPVSEEAGRRYDAMGKLIEFVVHELLKNKAKFGITLPVNIGDIAVGNPLGEGINIDLSCYANPLFMRDIRLPFSTHQKHKMHPERTGKRAYRNVPVQIAVPRFTPCNGNHLTLGELFANRRHFHNAANYAGAITCEIPECSMGINNLIEAYVRSSLGQFHHFYDQSYWHAPQEWSTTYDRYSGDNLPPCGRILFIYPNPLMLQPTQLQTMVRILCARGWWEPKHVAGLIRSYYERPYRWEINWEHYDAAMWAAVWVRFYAALIAEGLDKLLDFNCRSHQEKGLSWGNLPYCVDPHCGDNLINYR